MTEQDFCYWLQGYFELLPKDAPLPLTDRQATLIYKHLDLVRETEGTKKSEFCEWVRTALDIACRVEGGDGRAAVTDLIRERLADRFAHVIDPQYPNQSTLNEIHAGNKPPGGKIPRC